MKKTLKQEKHIDNGTSVILEEIRSQFKSFGEAHSFLVDKVDNFEKDVKNQFMAFGEGQDILSNKVDKIDKRLENVEAKVDAIDERLIRVEDNVVEIKHKLSEKVDLEDFQKLEMRLIKLEKIVFQKM